MGHLFNIYMKSVSVLIFINCFICYLTQGQDAPRDFKLTPFKYNNSDLLNTFLYAGDEGQIRSETESQDTISLFTDGISISDFASHTVNNARNEPNQAKLKISLINQAQDRVNNSIS